MSESFFRATSCQVGSVSAQGAASSLLPETLKRITEAFVEGSVPDAFNVALRYVPGCGFVWIEARPGTCLEDNLSQFRVYRLCRHEADSAPWP